MKIKKVAFWDNELEWRFEPISFSNLALLVGVSGVGKTQILKGILSLQQIANGGSLNGLGWDITFATLNNVEYRWQGEFETRAGAIEFEQQIKGWSRAKKEALIRGRNRVFPLTAMIQISNK